MNIWIKYAITAALVVLISEIALRLPRLGALIASLPLVSILVLSWLWWERAPQQRIADHAFYTFWYVVPTLPLFLLFPYLLSQMRFWPALIICLGVTGVLIGLWALLLKPFGITLL